MVASRSCYKHVQKFTAIVFLILILSLHSDDSFPLDVHSNDILVPRRTLNFTIPNRHWQSGFHSTRLPSPPSILTVRIHFERCPTTALPPHDQRRHQRLPQSK